MATAMGNMNPHEEIAALNTQPQSTAERYRTLLEINNAIITKLTQHTLLHSVSEALRRVIAFDAVTFTLYDPTREMFRFLAVEGPLSSEYFRVGLEFGRQDCISAWVFDHQRPVVRHDLENEHRYPHDRRALAEGIHSDCVVPLIVSGEAIGTLHIGSRERDRYSDSDAELLRQVANQVALAVANMQSYEEIAALKARLEKENVYL
ncbi:MAG TPA: GAF domain-containing protein, partial [Gemmatimonadales bacterium]|nr:GAF domain-containing protein [Gemmatimonadales bacterium]